jgi:hypothetical protein
MKYLCFFILVLFFACKYTDKIDYQNIQRCEQCYDVHIAKMKQMVDVFDVFIDQLNIDLDTVKDKYDYLPCFTNAPYFYIFRFDSSVISAQIKYGSTSLYLTNELGYYTSGLIFDKRNQIDFNLMLANYRGKGKTEEGIMLYFHKTYQNGVKSSFQILFKELPKCHLAYIYLHFHDKYLSLIPSTEDQFIPQGLSKYRELNELKAKNLETKEL